MRRGLLISAFSLLIAAAGQSATAAPHSPTPTPRARLSGGFGRPRVTATPQAPADGGQSLADVVRAAQDTRSASDKPAGADKSVVIDNHSLVTDPSKGRLTTSRTVHHEPTPGRTAGGRGGKATAAAAAHETGAGASPGGQPNSATAGASAPALDGAPAPPTEAGPAAPTEKEWRGIADAARKRVVDGKAKVADLDATTRKLENDFYSWDDGQYRDRVIKPAWDSSRQQLEQAKADLAAAEKELADLPERARRAGALPGWIRE